LMSSKKIFFFPGG